MVKGYYQVSWLDNDENVLKIFWRFIFSWNHFPNLLWYTFKAYIFENKIYLFIYYLFCRHEYTTFYILSLD